MHATSTVAVTSSLFSICVDHMSYYGGTYSSSPTVQPTWTLSSMPIDNRTMHLRFSKCTSRSRRQRTLSCSAHRYSHVSRSYCCDWKALTLIRYFALNVLALSISETGARVTYSFYVIYALYEFFYEVGIILVILTLATVGQMPRIARAAIAVLLSLLCLVCFAITIRLVVLQVNEPAYQQNRL
ncbi:hypothetical protein MRB53_041670 [Persea americana]|nr:hypothetical protein MRB53_041670 [Persea americana]